MSESARHHRSREAIRLGLATWRFARRLDGHCTDCDRCDSPGVYHDDSRCHLHGGWFAGEATVCPACFAERIRIEIGPLVVDQVVTRAALGDADAVNLLGRCLEA